MMKHLPALFAAALIATVAAPALASGPYTHGPGHERPRLGGPATTYTCADELGFLRRVYTEEIEGIFDQQEVSIQVVCEGSDYGVMRNDGNAGALRQVIAQTEATADALAAANFRPEDVVGVRMTGDESAVLYVHTFLYR